MICDGEKITIFIVLWGLHEKKDAKSLAKWQESINNRYCCYCLHVSDLQLKQPWLRFVPKQIPNKQKMKQQIIYKTCLQYIISVDFILSLLLDCMSYLKNDTFGYSNFSLNKNRILDNQHSSLKFIFLGHSEVRQLFWVVVVSF